MGIKRLYYPWDKGHSHSHSKQDHESKGFHKIEFIKEIVISLGSIVRGLGSVIVGTHKG